jgi:hypothetical protein
MKPPIPFICVLFAATAAACASNHSTPSSVPEGSAQWEGSFRTTQYAANAVMAPAGQAGRAAGYGSIRLTPVASGPGGNLQVEVSISAPVSAGTQLAWAIFSGPCGTMSDAVAGVMQFPTIPIANGGSGFVRATMPLPLDRQGSYHANVYWTAQASDVSNVMMCANLALAKR